MQCIAFSVVFVVWKRVSTIRRSATVRSVMPRERDHRSPTQQMGRLQLSGVMSQYISFSNLTVAFVVYLTTLLVNKAIGVIKFQAPY
jgi:hypothetical protein